jgi:hypothetical protein
VPAGREQCACERTSDTAQVLRGACVGCHLRGTVSVRGLAGRERMQVPRGAVSEVEWVAATDWNEGRRQGGPACTYRSISL